MFFLCNEAQTTTIGPHVCSKGKKKEEKSATRARNAGLKTTGIWNTKEAGGMGVSDKSC